MAEPVQLTLGFPNRPRLVPIDEATVYDIPTSLVRLATSIKNNEHGLILNAIVILHERKPTGSYNVFGLCYGFDNRAKMVEMCESMKLTLMGVKHGSSTQ